MKRLILVLALVLACGACGISSLAQSPPSLRIDSSTGSRMQLSWEETLGTIVLEASDTLTPSSDWRPFQQYPTLSDGRYSVMVDATGGRRFFRLHRIETGGLPPDPAWIAPPVPPGIATQLSGATEFLYSGPNRIQTGVAPGTIHANRAAVVRGHVSQRDNRPLSGVTISILHHPELGRTLSRADGRFDLAVNGGGLLTVNYEKTGFCPVQRQCDAPWQDYVSVQDAVMIPMDPIVTPIMLGLNSPMQVHQGSMQADVDGARRATLIFKPGTCGSLVLADGTTQDCSSISVRATEFTVGTNGPAAMPGDLPPSSGYTYCVELTADEAIAAGAKEVRFATPVPFYVDNFVGFPVGSQVPLGSYDRDKGQWVASDNGRVIKVISITGGLADLDLDGNGTIDDAAALAALGIADDERGRLATLYSPGQELWRVLIPHFTPYDLNWAWGPKPNSEPPDKSKPKVGPEGDKPPKGDPNKDCGSIIGSEVQTLGEVIHVTGAPLSLHYQSDRVPGRLSTRLLKIRLSGATLPPDLQRIHLAITVAGQAFKKDFLPQANLFDTFIWDGKDAYGRPVQGKQPVHVRIGYEYLAQYYATQDTLEASYNRFGLPPISGGGGGGAVIFSRPPARTTTPPIILWQEFEDSVGSLLPATIGGWSPNLLHSYDPGGRILYLGNGDQRSATSMGAVISTLGQIPDPWGIAEGSDGSLYIADNASNRIRRLGTDGIITTVAGLPQGGSSGDGGPATQARITTPRGVAIGPDGSVYIPESTARVRRVGPDGIITTVAGTGVSGYSGDGGPATQAQLNDLRGGIAVGPDGSLYIADTFNHRIRRVGTDGIIATVAGTGVAGYSEPGVPATQCRLDTPTALAVANDGTLYTTNLSYGQILKVGTDGIITQVGDRQSTTAPSSVAVGPDGSLYWTNYNNLIYRVSPEGTVTTVAGNGGFGSTGDGGPPTQALLGNPKAVAVGSDGSLFISDTLNSRIRRIGPPVPGLGSGEILIAAEDGSEAYIFDGAGRHLRTVDTRTAAVRFEFAYDSAGRLSTITDGNGNITSIERDGSGTPIAIVAPFGQRTTLTVNADGYLSRVTNPAGEAVQLTYNTGDAEGLLATLSDPRGNLHRYFYDPLGRLVRDENPAGGTTTLARTDITDDHYAVTLSTAMGLATTYEVEELPTGETRRIRIDPGGARTESLYRTDGSRRIAYPDGTVAEFVDGPDPRFGMQAPILAAVNVVSPGGITSSRSWTRTATLSEPGNPLTLTSLTDTITRNGQIFKRTYDGATRKITTTSPEARQSSARLDALGRVVEVQRDPASGLLPLQSTYDGLGRLTKLGQGTQTWSYFYDNLARLTDRTDAAGNSLHFGYDLANRRNLVTLPSGRTYDLNFAPENQCCGNGSPTQVIMPGGGVHQIDYTPINQESSYSPPGNSPYVSSYDKDARLTLVTLPTGRTESFSYDSANRPTGISYPEAAVVLAYAPADPTARISRLTLTPTAGGPAQEGVYTYSGGLVTGVKWTGAANGEYRYTYDSNTLLGSRAISSGADAATTLLTHDHDGLLTGLGPFTFTRNGPTGDTGKISDGTLNITTGSDPWGRIANRNHTVNGVDTFSIQFSYNSVGLITRKVETIAAGGALTYDYVYDADSQLTEVRLGGVIAERYTYDPNRNRSSRQRGVNPAETASYDSQDRLIQQGPVSFQFDADGYLTQRGTDTFRYSTTGELLQAVAGGQTVSYAYDGLRRRVSRTDSAGTTQYLYGNPDNDLEVSHFRDPLGILTTCYYDVGGHLFALQRGSDRYYVATDQLGSPRVITDAAGALVRIVEYDGFGHLNSDSNPAFALPVGYAGGLADAATGFVRFGFRDYDPETGHWTARDPAGFQGNQANLYAYVNNNPVNLVDRSGFISGGISLCDGICGGFKIAITAEGISLCGEAGVGEGNSVEIDPFAPLAEDGWTGEAKFGVKEGSLKIEAGYEVSADPDPCGRTKGKLKFESCVGPACFNTKNEGKGKFSLDPKKNPLELQDKAWKAKVVGKYCRQGKW